MAYPATWCLYMSLPEHGVTIVSHAPTMRVPTRTVSLYLPCAWRASHRAPRRAYQSTAALPGTTSPRHAMPLVNYDYDHDYDHDQACAPAPSPAEPRRAGGRGEGEIFGWRKIESLPQSKFLKFSHTWQRLKRMSSLKKSGSGIFF